MKSKRPTKRERIIAALNQPFSLRATCEQKQETGEHYSVIRRKCRDIDTKKLKQKLGMGRIVDGIILPP